jgi:NAD(P)-dependent dehydrogenase (short-subunit alcohol dehydrogenase family)
MSRLSGKFALVTGAAAGIGRDVSELFAAEGAHVFLADIDGAGAAAAAAAIRDAGLKATGIVADVSRGQDVSAMFRSVEQTTRTLDVIVNNAGLNVRGDFRHMSDADWEKIREVNLDGVVRVARDGFALLSAGGGGALINVSSIMARRGLRQLAAYSATKGAVSALTRALAVEYAPFNVRVNALAPGFIETALTARVLRNPALRQALIDETPMRRLGTGKEIAEAALFLASDAAAYITGAELVVDGGMTASL